MYYKVDKDWDEKSIISPVPTIRQSPSDQVSSSSIIHKTWRT